MSSREVDFIHVNLVRGTCMKQRFEFFSPPQSGRDALDNPKSSNFDCVLFVHVKFDYQVELS